jgi:hypothetical protein
VSTNPTPIFFLGCRHDQLSLSEIVHLDLHGLGSADLLVKVWLAPSVERAPRLLLVHHVAQDDGESHLELALQVFVVRLGLEEY